MPKSKKRLRKPKPSDFTMSDGTYNYRAWEKARTDWLVEKAKINLRKHLGR